MAALMVLGTSSWAGKSLLATALCRWFAREGVRVAPFKAQNMSNNARVASGGEMGAAQYWQALAAGVEPHVRMNPVLVKPEADDRSQVVLGGRVDRELSARAWTARAPGARAGVEAALRSLLGDFELVVVEGAGSPAEVNLFDSDLANLYVGELTGANSVLVADISRGGALAHLFGTRALMPETLRARVGGFVLNRFRGDPTLLAPAPATLEERTGVPTIGVLPELDHRLPDEDGAAARTGAASGPVVAVVRYPTSSNLDELRVLEESAQVVWARRPADVMRADLVVLPGSKQPLVDLDWLRWSGVGEAVKSVAGRGVRVLGICGGLQLLGRAVEDEPGLGLLPVETVFVEDKLVTQRTARFGELPEPWRVLCGREVSGYEIRQGRTTSDTAGATIADELGFAAGSVLGLYLHGLLEDPDVVEALTGTRPSVDMEQVFDDLADALDRHLDMRRVRTLAGLGAAATPKSQAPETPPLEDVAPRSLVLVNTGDGKGKSTAAFGVLLRAVARRGWRSCVVQFIKSDRWKVGEEASARRLDVEWVKGGDGFSWESRDLATSEQLAQDAWHLARARIESGDYQLIVLDEVTYPINWGWIDGAEVARAIQNRPERVNVIATGRDAPPALIAVADTVTEMVKVRHAYDRGIKARRGLDF